MEPLAPDDVPTRLSALAKLQDGWLDGGGVAPPADGIRWLADAWFKHVPDDLPDPYTYPTEDGGIQFEWTFGSHEVSAKVDLRSRGANLLVVDVDGDDSAEMTTNLGNPAGWKVLADFVGRQAAAQRA